MVGFIRESIRTLEPYYNITIGESDMTETITTGVVAPSDSVFEQKHSLNTILFGSHVTGKTYNTVLYAVAICEQASISVNFSSYSDQSIEILRQIVKNNQENTFHWT
jgi:hypothetical protein